MGKAQDIKALNAQFGEIVAALETPSNVNLRLAAENWMTRALIVAIGVESERAVCEVIENMAVHHSSNPQLHSFVKNKGTKRQYHSMFQWDGGNANSFFGLFGESFSNRMKELAKSDADFRTCVNSFLYLGQLRNLLAHEDFCGISLSITRADVIGHYDRAKQFICYVSRELDAI